MRIVLQRVSRARVVVADREVASIRLGVLLLVASGLDDDPGDPKRLAEKVAGLRIFADADGRMNRSVVDVGGAGLVVPQFTLYADVRRGRRPFWAGAARPDVAADRVEALAKALEGLGIDVARGEFRAHMQVELVNDGPVTLFLDAREL